MKNYIKTVIIVSFIIGSHSYSDASVVNMNLIRPVGLGPDAIVNAIKQYSNITEADVNKYKLLWLGWFGAVPALVMGGGSLYGGQKVGGMMFDYVTGFDYVKEKFGLKPINVGTLARHGIESKIDQSSVKMVSDFLKTRTPWITAAALGAGFVSYKLLYPRVRQGVMHKVQNFLDLCARLTVAKKNVYLIEEIEEWSMGMPIAICKAFENLEKQAQCADQLLIQVGLADTVVNNMHKQLQKYYAFLSNNKNYWNSWCSQLAGQEQGQINAALQQQGLESQIFGQKIQNVKNVVSIVQKVGSGIFNFARDVANFGIQNKEPLGMLGAGYWLYKTFYSTPSSTR